jgi:hypothetical protein
MNSTVDPFLMLLMVKYIRGIITFRNFLSQ